MAEGGSYALRREEALFAQLSWTFRVHMCSLNLRPVPYPLPSLSFFHLFCVFKMTILKSNSKVQRRTGCRYVCSEMV